MKLDQDNIAGLMMITFLLIFTCLLGGAVAWESHQVRVMYSNAYQKNLDCRTSMKGSTPSLIAHVCGPIPKFEDYQK
jgi:hypothetical protein